MVTLTWCDQCLAEKDEEVQAASMPPYDGMQVDLCSEHAAPVMAARNVYATYGSTGSRHTLRPSTVQKAGKAGAATCPQAGCGAVLNGRQSLAAHARQIHGMTIGQLEGKAITHPCTYPDCDRGFTSPQALALHERAHVRQSQQLAESA
jgi:hypothetical protein